MRVNTPIRHLLAVGAAGALVVAASAAVSAPAGEAHLPDLQTKRATLKNRLTIDTSTGKKLLRFSNTVWNAGDGPLEVRPDNSGATNSTQAYQRVFTHDDQGTWQLVEEFLVGTFQFHEEHNHWHFSDFALYELRDVAAGGGVGTIKRTGQKETFCIADTTQVNSGLEHSPARRVYRVGSCDQNSNAGLSVGWGDTYRWDLPGQEIDITGLPDGQYWLVSTADPKNRLRETNDGNNTAKLKIQITGDTVAPAG
ncbi:MAG: lysyl oxidase family protein [Actinomycetota bacterium]